MQKVLILEKGHTFHKKISLHSKNISLLFIKWDIVPCMKYARVIPDSEWVKLPKYNEIRFSEYIFLYIKFSYFE